MNHIAQENRYTAPIWVLLSKKVQCATRTIVTLALVSCGMLLQLHAQSDSGRVVGTVTDTSGAVIQGAILTLTGSANGLALTSTSNSSGVLNVPAVPRGNYSAKIEAEGFQSQSQSVTVTVTQVQSLLFKLQPGNVSTTVEVTGAASLVNMSDATLGATIQEEQITELPLNGRNALNLALLSPGVTQGIFGEDSQDTVQRNGESGGEALSVNGMRMQANNFILDGIDNNDGLQNIILFFPPVEATQEFKIVTSVAPAQFGRAGGALIVSSIRSGTNQIHGSASEFYRSGKFDANPGYRFLDAPESPNPPYNRNQFSGSTGLPVIKDKLFAFGDYQGYRETLPANPSYHTVPTPLMRTGNFSELLNPASTYGSFATTFPVCVPNAGDLNDNLAANSKGQIYDPQTCKPFSGNIIPTERLNPAAINYFNAYPLPTRTDRVLQNYLVHQRAANKYDTFDLRLDWNPSSRDIAFLRFSYDNSTNTITSVLAPTLPAGQGSGSNYVHARGYDLGYTHTFAPTLVNEARLGYNRDNYGYQPPQYGVPVSANLGIVNANRNLETSGGALIGGYNNELEYTGDYGLFAVPQNTYELTDTMTVTRGRHSIKAGGTLLRRQVSYFRPIAGKGFFSIAGNGKDFTGYEPTELLVGGVDTYSIGAQNGYFGNFSQEDAIFGQDDWRVNRRLTLNLGVRWDLLTWPDEMHNRQASFDIHTGTVLMADQNGVSRSIVNQNYDNFAPRVGFAYSLRADGRAAIRGGYGIFYFPDYGGINNQLGQQAPFGGEVNYQAKSGYCITFTGQTSALGAPFSCPGYTSPAAVTTALPAPGFQGFNPTQPPNGLSGLAVDRNNEHSRVHEWNLELEQQFGTHNVFTVAYVGARGDRLSTYYPYNSFRFGSPTLNYPHLGAITYNVYSGISNYDGLQMHMEHRTANAAVTGSYTWSHALDDSPGAFQSSTAPIYSSPFSDYGNSLNDERHIFSSSVIYHMPFGRGQRFGHGVSRPLDFVIGGWQTNLIARLTTGQPFDLSTGANTPGNRPDQIGPIQYPKKIQGYWFNPASFSSNIPTLVAGSGTAVYTRLGTMARDQVYGPGNRTVDLGLQKNLHLSGRINLELHGDAFNALNTPQFVNPGSTLSNPGSFGIVTETKANTNRQIQLTGRLTF